MIIVVSPRPLEYQRMLSNGDFCVVWNPLHPHQESQDGEIVFGVLLNHVMRHMIGKSIPRFFVFYLGQS